MYDKYSLSFKSRGGWQLLLGWGDKLFDWGKTSCFARLKSTDHGVGLWRIKDGGIMGFVWGFGGWKVCAGIEDVWFGLTVA